MATPTVYTNRNMLNDSRRWPTWLVEAALTHYGIAFTAGADHASLYAALTSHFPAGEMAQAATFGRTEQEAARVAHNAVVHPTPDPVMRKFVEDYNRANWEVRKQYASGPGLDVLNILSLVLIGAQWLARTTLFYLVWGIVAVEAIDLWKDFNYLMDVRGKNAPANMVLKAALSCILNVVVIALVVFVGPELFWLPLSIKLIDTIVEYLARQS